MTPEERVHAYRLYAMKTGIPPRDSWDVAQEMYCLALEEHRRSSFPVEKQKFKWLLARAIAVVFNCPRTCDYHYRKKQKHVYREDLRELDLTLDAHSAWMDSVWAATRRDGREFLHRYACETQGVVVRLDCYEIQELYGQLLNHKQPADHYVDRLIKIGKKFILVDGKKLFHSELDAMREYNVTRLKLRKNHSIQTVHVCIKDRKA